MNLAEIERTVAELDFDKGFELIYDLLLAYGLPKASVTRLRTGDYNRSTGENERLWKGKVFYRFVEDPGLDLHSVIDDARNDEQVLRERPRFLIVRDAERLLAIDTRTETTLDVRLLDLAAHSAFFLPWAGIEKTQLEGLHYADVKAAEKMARLYDEIVSLNAIEDEVDVRHLNVFFSRLLFCFFAEDTRVFEAGIFTDAVASLTQADGSDTGPFLDQLFEVLDTAPEDRSDIQSHFREFGFVNGRLFADRASAPRFSAKGRRILLECGTLDWSQINPDIFGSMIQAVVHPSQREGLGMHYTSVENIMKVIRPLFLDELAGRFERADSVPKLQQLLDHICEIKLFDPACGSGNFLVIAYKELRKLEHRILQRIGDLDPNKVGMFKISGIQLDHFYGIEIDDFAHEVAVLSLWLAKHQMNVEFFELFGVEVPLIPLRETGNVVCANAARAKWTEICPLTPEGQVYVMGNPPYRGGKLQTPEQKADFVAYYGTEDYARNLDYISLWFLKGAEYISAGGAELGFVSTNSIVQGDHVGLLWQQVLDRGVQISFAHETFRWSNQAKGNAGVSCVVVGLSADPPARRRHYSGAQARLVSNITPYLKPAERNTIVRASPRPLNGLPTMLQGSRASDGGYLTLSPAEKASIVADAPGVEKFIRSYVGSKEFINGLERYCLWIDDEDAEEASRIPSIAERLVSIQRLRSGGGASARAVADVPHRFGHRAHKATHAIIVPGVSSERRTYIPMGFLDGSTVVSHLAYVVYDAEPWIYGLLQSQMHMAWVDTVGGRMESRYRYSAQLIYNTFPVPVLSDVSREALAAGALAVLETREAYSHETLARLYDPDKMPERLRHAHAELDRRVDSIYRGRAFSSDTERIEMLFSMYEDLLTNEGTESDA